jgi:hypothetical protein
MILVLHKRVKELRNFMQSEYIFEVSSWNAKHQKMLLLMLKFMMIANEFNEAKNKVSDVICRFTLNF